MRPILIALLAALPAHAQTVLYALRSNGQILRIDQATGAASPIGQSAPADALAEYFVAGARSPNIEYLLTASIAAPQPALTAIDRWSGATLWTRPLSPPVSVRTMTKRDQGDTTILSLVIPDLPGVPIQYAGIQQLSGEVFIFGSTGRNDLEAIAIDPWSNIPFALSSAGALYWLDPSTGAAHFIGSGNYDGARALAFLPTAELVACGTNLLSVNRATGETTLIGPTGYADIRDLAVITSCYANCEGAGPPPMLNVLDFNCFLNRFAAGDLYANCDFSSTPPVLNILDFNCFLNNFTSGCSAP